MYRFHIRHIPMSVFPQHWNRGVLGTPPHTHPQHKIQTNTEDLRMQSETWGRNIHFLRILGGEKPSWVMGIDWELNVCEIWYQNLMQLLLISVISTGRWAFYCPHSNFYWSVQLFHMYQEEVEYMYKIQGMICVWNLFLEF